VRLFNKCKAGVKAGSQGRSVKAADTRVSDTICGDTLQASI